MMRRWWLAMLLVGCAPPREHSSEPVDTAVRAVAAHDAATHLHRAYELADGRREVLDVWGGRALIGAPQPVGPNSDGPLVFDVHLVSLIDGESEPLGASARAAIFTADGTLLVRAHGALVHRTSAGETQLAPAASGLFGTPDRRTFAMGLGQSPDTQVALWTIGDRAPRTLGLEDSPVWSVSVSDDASTVRFATASAAGVTLVEAPTEGQRVSSRRPVSPEHTPVGRRAALDGDCLIFESPSGLMESCGETLRALGPYSRPLFVDGRLFVRPAPADRLAGLNLTEAVTPVEVDR